MRSHVKGRPHKERVAETKDEFRNGLIDEIPESEITLIKNEVIAVNFGHLCSIKVYHDT